MMDMGYPLHLIDLLAKLYSQQLAKVKVAGILSEWFPVKKGVRQSCVLSPYLFNILAEMVMRETLDGFQGGLQIGGRMITNLRYADDIILLAASEAELQELVDRLDTQEEWRNTSWGLWDERTEKDSACFLDSKEKNEWVLNKAGVKRELLDTVKASKDYTTGLCHAFP